MTTPKTSCLEGLRDIGQAEAGTLTLHLAIKGRDPRKAEDEGVDGAGQRQENRGKAKGVVKTAGPRGSSYC